LGGLSVYTAVHLDIPYITRNRKHFANASNGKLAGLAQQLILMPTPMGNSSIGYKFGCPYYNETCYEVLCNAARALTVIQKYTV
jgi:hypothetical protein